MKFEFKTSDWVESVLNKDFFVSKWLALVVCVCVCETEQGLVCVCGFVLVQQQQQQLQLSYNGTLPDSHMVVLSECGGNKLQFLGLEIFQKHIFPHIAHITQTH